MLPTKENRSIQRNSRNFTILIQKFTYAPEQNDRSLAM